MKTSETKKFAKIFCLLCLIFDLKKYFHFYNEGFFNSQAVGLGLKIPCLKATVRTVAHPLM
jgi:hypothetical protein